MKKSYTEPDRQRGRFKMILDRIITLEDDIKEIVEINQQLLNVMTETKGRISKYLEQVELLNNEEK